MGNNEIPVNRRKVLKTTALGLTGIAGGTVSASASSSPSVLEEATTLRAEQEDNDAFVDYLEERGFRVKTQSQEVAIPDQSANDGSIGTKDRNRRSSITVDFNFLERGPPGPTTNWWLDGHFLWEVSNPVDNGNRCGRNDLISFHWSKDEFEFKGSEAGSDWGNSKTYLKDYDIDYYSLFAFNDCNVGAGSVVNGYARSDIDPVNPNQGRFLMKYYHRWDNSTISQIQLWGIGFNSASTQWVTDPLTLYW